MWLAIRKFINIKRVFKTKPNYTFIHNEIHVGWISEQAEKGKREKTTAEPGQHAGALQDAEE